MTQPNFAARLIGKSGEYQGSEFFIKGDEFAIGRAFECHLMLNDNMISSRHAHIVRQGEHYQIEDLGSTNGTFVNGEKIDKKQLRTGDKVMIGGLEFEFVQPLDVSRTMVATPEAMAELARAKAGAAHPAAAPVAAPVVESVKIPETTGGGSLIGGLIPGLIMGLLIAYVLPLLSAAFQMKKAGALTITNLLEFIDNWASVFPGLHSHVGVKGFTTGNWTGIVVIVGLALGPIVGGFLVARIGKKGPGAVALSFTFFYFVVAAILQLALLKFDFSQLPEGYPGIVSSLGAWGNVALGLGYFFGVVFILSFIGALLGRTKQR
jgi:hypothetical protein